MEVNLIKNDWKVFCERNYIVKNLYSCYGLLHDNFGLVPCPYGGPFLKRSLGPSSLFYFITNNGEKVIYKEIKCSKNVYRLFWCSGGKIGILTGTGNIEIYRISGELVSTVQCPSQEYILAASAFYNGIVFLKENGEFFFFDMYFMKIRPLITIFQNYLCGTELDTICSIDFLKTKEIACFAGFKNGSIFSISEKEVKLVKTVKFEPTKIQISSSGDSVAVTNGHEICVFSTREETGNEFSQTFSDEISSFSFLESDRVVCVVKNQAYLCTSNNPATLLPFDEVKFVVQDFDHIRLFSDKGAFIVLPVPGPVSGLLRNKKIPLVFDARKKFDEGDFSGVTKLLEMSDELPRLFQMLTLSALNLLDSVAQEYLMSAASLIVHTDDLLIHQNADEFRATYVDTLRRIRFLNTLRSPEFGFTTTAACLEINQPANIIEFAMEMNRFEFAYKACNIFEYNNTVVASFWAYAMFYKYGDKALGSVIGKLEIIQNVDYSLIVKAAINARLSQKSLSVLVDRVRNPTEKCSFLIDVCSMYKVNNDALDYAIYSLDGAAIIRSLFYLKNALGPEKFGELLSSNNIALDHYIAFKRFIEAKNVCHVIGINAAKAMQVLMVNELPPRNFGIIPEQLFALSRLLDKKLIWSKTVRRHSKALTAIADKEVKDRKKNKEVNTYNIKQTPREIVKDAIKNGEGEFAMKIAKQYHVTPRMFAYIQLETFYEMGNWENIESMGKIKQPLSIEEFFKFCLEHNNKYSAMSFVKRLKTVQKQVELLKSYGLDDEAERLQRENGKRK